VSVSRVISRDFLFEVLVGIVLENSGFTRVSRGTIRGRGGFHQTDAYGDYFLGIPFVYKVHLLAEAKYWNLDKPVHIGVARDVLARVADIDQKYTVETYTRKNVDDEYSRRTVRGAIFSASGFYESAKKFCYAHGIYCVDFPTGLRNVQTGQIMEKILGLLDSAWEKKRFPSSLRNWKSGQDVFFKVMRNEVEFWRLPDEEKHHFRGLIKGFVLNDESTRKEAEDLGRLSFVSVEPIADLAIFDKPVDFDIQLLKLESDTLSSNGISVYDKELVGTVDILPPNWKEPIKLYLSRDYLEHLFKIGRFKLEGVFYVRGARRILTVVVKIAHERRKRQS